MHIAYKISIALVVATFLFVLSSAWYQTNVYWKIFGTTCKQEYSYDRQAMAGCENRHMEFFFPPPPI